MASLQTTSFWARSWSPWVVGLALGVLSWFAFATAQRGLGITTPFEQAAALATQALAPQSTGITSYLADEDAPTIGWAWMVVIGVFLGSFVSANVATRARASARDAKARSSIVPPLWAARFGESVPLRLASAFGGGVILMLGARIARGCTSGHGITGALQLAAASWIFISVAFAVAVATAFVLFGRERDHV